MSGHGMYTRNASLNQSAASLRDILEQETSEFDVLQASKMYGDGQKRQMSHLNSKLKDYMKMNRDLDEKIAKLNADIAKAKHNANHQDDDIKRKIDVIRTQKETINKLREDQKKTNIQLEKVKLRNENCAGDCKRYDQQIKELDAKVRNVNAEIERAEEEKREDQRKFDLLLPEKERLEKEQREREIEHRRKMEELLKNRKKTQILPVPKMQENLPKLLENYRKTHISDKEAKPAEIKALEEKVARARQRSRDLDKQILLTHREKDKVELEIRKLDSEIQQAEQNCENVRKQMKLIDENHRKEVEAMNETISNLEAEKAHLQKELENAEYELKQVQNQKIGDKAPIEPEVRQMERLLNEKSSSRLDEFVLPLKSRPDEISVPLN